MLISLCTASRVWVGSRGALTLSPSGAFGLERDRRLLGDQTGRSDLGLDDHSFGCGDVVALVGRAARNDHATEQSDVARCIVEDADDGVQVIAEVDARQVGETGNAQFGCGIDAENGDPVVTGDMADVEPPPTDDPAADRIEQAW